MYIDIDRAIEALKGCTNETDRRIAEWLKELKRRRDLDGELIGSGALKNAYQQGYNKAIDDCKELTFREVVYRDSLNDRTEFRELAEQLKAGGENDA